MVVDLIKVEMVNNACVSSSVASNILKMETHKLDLGEECSITVEARPVHLMVPSLVEVKQHKLMCEIELSSAACK